MRCCRTSSSTTLVVTASRKARSWLAMRMGPSWARDEVGHESEPAGVEVVGRLVEQEHVVLAEQHGDEARAGGLTAGERAEGAVRRDVEADARGHLGQPLVEVGGAEREPALERDGVAVLAAGVAAGDGGGSGLELGVRSGHAGAATGVRQQRLRRVGHDLGQPADRRVARGETDRAGIDRQLADDRAHERRLARPVGADDRRDVAVREGQVESGEESAGTEGDVEAGEGEGGRHGRSLMVGRAPRVTSDGGRQVRDGRARGIRRSTRQRPYAAWPPPVHPFPAPRPRPSPTIERAFRPRRGRTCSFDQTERVR